MPKQVLVVDDGGTVADALRRLLPAGRYAMSTVSRERALHQAGSDLPDLIVLSGLSAPTQVVDLARRLHQQASGTRIVAVVPSDSVTCDAAGVTRLSKLPTEAELVGWLDKDGQSTDERVLRVGRISLNLDTRQLDADGQISVLTPKQARLLALLMRHPGETLTRKRLMKDVWDTDYTGDTRTLDVHIHWVREKLGDVPGVPTYLRTVRRVGYRFVDPDGASGAAPGGDS
jgi:DNA-binding response OmpR family regulator